MKSLLVNWFYIMLPYLEFSRTLNAYWLDIYQTFINFPYIFKIGEISPVTQMLHLPSFVKKNLERMFS